MVVVCVSWGGSDNIPPVETPVEKVKACCFCQSEMDKGVSATGVEGVGVGRAVPSRYL